MNSRTRAVLGPEDYQVLPRTAQQTACAVWRLDGPQAVQVDVTRRGLALDVPVAVETDGDTRLKVVVTLPVGGPYEVRLRSDGRPDHCVTGLLVGDLWVLAGQSNMQGVGLGADALRPLRHCSALGLDNRWAPAVEPLHRLWQSADNTQLRLWHLPNPALSREQVISSYPELHAQDAHSPIGGVGPGYFFGLELYALSGVPVGLLPCALGGASMSLWSKTWALEHAPDDPAGSLYGNLVERARRVGPVRGVLWYQGESEAMSELGASYFDLFAQFVHDVREDLGLDQLPFLTVQLGSFAADDPHFARIADQLPVEWDLVREAQRLAAMHLPGVGLVASADLPRVDLVHLSTEAHRVLGRRLALQALDVVNGSAPSGGPAIDDVRLSDGGERIVLQLRNFRDPVPDESAPAAFALDGCGATVTAVESLSPDRLALTLNRRLEGPASLWYGRGPEPVARIVDALGQALPCFGPVLVG